MGIRNHLHPLSPGVVTIQIINWIHRYRMSDSPVEDEPIFGEATSFARHAIVTLILY